MENNPLSTPEAQEMYSRLKEDLQGFLARREEYFTETNFPKEDRQYKLNGRKVIIETKKRK